MGVEHHETSGDLPFSIPKRSGVALSVERAAKSIAINDGWDAAAFGGTESGGDANLAASS
jgi:hypothetical protein